MNEQLAFNAAASIVREFQLSRRSVSASSLSDAARRLCEGYQQYDKVVREWVRRFLNQLLAAKELQVIQTSAGSARYQAAV
ncbi:MAG: hypothetical protein WBB39_02545 [Candidatus Saccharimonadales bacterium]